MFLPFRVAFTSLLLAAVASAASRPEISATKATPATPANGSVTFEAKVDPKDALTSVVFQYGKPGAASRKTTPKFISADAPATDVSETAMGLFGGQTYDFSVVAENSAGRTTSTAASFTIAPYAAVLTIEKASNVAAGRATLKAKVRANGTTGTAVFEYAQNSTFSDSLLRSRETWEITGAEEARPLSTTVDGLERNKTYFVQLVLLKDDARVAVSGPESFTTNLLPIARADTFILKRRQPTSLDVLKNDRDGDGDDLLVTEVAGATKGTATITADGKQVAYVPGANFRGTDSFTYKARDAYGVSVTAATVTIRAFGVLLAGSHGGVILDANGSPVGYLKFTVTADGAVTGSVLVDGEKKSFSGVVGPDGVLRTTLEIDGQRVPLALTASVNGTTTTVEARLADGRWTSSLRTTEASAARRADLAGRYTVEFPSGTSTSEPSTGGGDPAGTGWATVKLGADGVARVKGRLPDGRSFSTTGLLGTASGGTDAVVTFFDDPTRTRVAGTLTIGQSIGGTLTALRDPGGGGKFADGYGIERTATGARYVPPEKGQRAIEGTSNASGRNLTFAVTGGSAGENFSRQIRLDTRDGVRVIDGGAEDLKMRIDPDSGRFTARFTGATDDQRLKGTGVFIQGASTSASALGRGAGIYIGETQTGRIAISAASTSTDSGTTATSTRP